MVDCVAQDQPSDEEKENKNDPTFDPKPKPKPKFKTKPKPQPQAPVAAPAGTTITGNPDVPDGKHQGTMQMGCLEALKACQNACYYQNCVMGAAGNQSTSRIKSDTPRSVRTIVSTPE